MKNPKIDLSQAIITLVELALSRFSPKKVLLLTINFIFEKGNETNYRNINFVFQRSSSYVFVGTYEGLMGGFWKGTEIKRKSYHDSCWSSDGVESTINIFWQSLEKEFPGHSCRIEWNFPKPKFLEGHVQEIDQKENLWKFIPKGDQENFLKQEIELFGNRKGWFFNGQEGVI